MGLRRIVLTNHTELPLVAPRENQNVFRTGLGETGQVEIVQVKPKDRYLVSPRSETLVSKSAWTVPGAIEATQTIETTRDLTIRAIRTTHTNGSAKTTACSVRVLAFLSASGKRERHPAARCSVYPALPAKIFLPR